MRRSAGGVRLIGPSWRRRLSKIAEWFIRLARKEGVKLQLKNSNAALRKALELNGFEPGKHRQEVEKLAQIHGHSIRFVRFNEGDLTCAPHALGLSHNRIYRSVAAFDPEVYAGPAFMEWLLDGQLREIEKPVAGCLVCYFSSAKWKHVGIVGSDGRVTSKWGELPLYEHGIDEVQESYGDEVRFFERPSDALKLFLQFASEKGISREDVKDALEEFLDYWTGESLH